MKDNLPKNGKKTLKGPGRPKGSQNKITVDIKAMVLAALDKAGGEKYLLSQAENNPNAFMTLLGKILPTQITRLNWCTLLFAGLSSEGVGN